MADKPSLGKYGLFGFQLQDAEGTEADGGAGNVTWCPMCDAPGFKWQANSVLEDQADFHEWDYLEHSSGHWWAGPVSVNLIPGAVANVKTWVQTRGSENQAKLATVWLVEEQGVRTAYDVKVGSAEFTFAREQPVRVSLDLAGKNEGTNATPDGYGSAIGTAAPFIMKDVLFAFKAKDSDGDDMGYTFKDLSLRWDNAVQDPAEGLRFNNSYVPYKLYNEADYGCTGTATRDRANNDFYTAWRKQHELGAGAGYDWYEASEDGSLTITVSRGVTMTFTLPRVRITDLDTGMLGSRRGTQDERIEFVALGSYAGDIAPITLS